MEDDGAPGAGFGQLKLGPDPTGNYRVDLSWLEMIFYGLVFAPVGAVFQCGLRLEWIYPNPLIFFE